ncbi:2756_t:CDS:1, partial [Scutellospora calospora]
SELFKESKLLEVSEFLKGKVPTLFINNNNTSSFCCCDGHA